MYRRIDINDARALQLRLFLPPRHILRTQMQRTYG
jgi:hypothetical protein